MASNTLKKLKYDNKEIQVESAIRDGAGQNIEATYATKDAIKFAPHYPTMTGTAAVTSGTTQCAKWNATDASITELYNGLCLHVKIPVAGNGTYFVGLSVNGGDYHPVVFNVNSTISTRYSVNSTIELIYNSTQTGNIYLNGTNTTVTGVWQAMDYDSNTTTTYGTLSYYLRPYTGANRLTAYKLVAFDKDNRIIPITTEQYLGSYSTSTTYKKDDIVVSSSKYYKSVYNGDNKNKAVTNTTYWTQITMSSTFTPNTTPFKPNKIYFYNTTAGVAAGTAIGGQTLTNVGYNTSVCSYTFWATIASYRMIYLQGTYNRTTGLFTLDTGANYYKLVPNNTASLTLSSYLTSGKDYILVGSTYSSNNYLQLFEVNTMYHFDGTNLIPYDTYNENRIENSIPSAVTESTVSGWGFTKNAGTVTSVRVQAGTGLSSSTSTTQSTSLNTTISIASGYKLPTTTEWSGKQDALVSGTSIKTINGNSLLGSGDLTISGGSGSASSEPHIVSGMPLLNYLSDLGAGAYPRLLKYSDTQLYCFCDNKFKVSSDGGKTWSSDWTTITTTTKEENWHGTAVTEIANACPFKLSSGRIGVAYRCHNKDNNYYSLRVIFSTKDATEWPNRSIVLVENTTGLWEPLVFPTSSLNFTMFYCCEQTRHGKQDVKKMKFHLESVTEATVASQAITICSANKFDSQFSNTRIGMPCITKLTDNTYFLIVENNCQTTTTNNSMVVQYAYMSTLDNYNLTPTTLTFNFLTSGKYMGAPYVTTLPDGRIVISFQTSQYYNGVDYEPRQYTSQWRVFVSKRPVIYSRVLSGNDFEELYFYNYAENEYGVWGSVQYIDGILYKACSVGRVDSASSRTAYGVYIKQEKYYPY